MQIETRQLQTCARRLPCLLEMAGPVQWPNSNFMHCQSRSAQARASQTTEMTTIQASNQPTSNTQTTNQQATSKQPTNKQQASKQQTINNQTTQQAPQPTCPAPVLTAVLHREVRNSARNFAPFDDALTATTTTTAQGTSTHG